MAELEILSGDRFAFGQNWKNFISKIDEGRIASAREAIINLLGVNCLEGKSFLDIGCGSGLMSLAAAQLGAKVVSFDYDKDSVDCALAMKEAHMPGSKQWSISQGSILDKDFLSSLGLFDIVYSWGVLHHTGQMWPAIDHASQLVAPAGTLALAIYNDQGGYSVRWRKVKRMYLATPDRFKKAFALTLFVLREIKPTLSTMVRLKNPIERWTRDQPRGMDFWTDWIDWIGGYPFEVAMPEDVFYFCKERGFILSEMKTSRGGLGCNEFVFQKSSKPDF